MELDQTTARIGIDVSPLRGKKSGVGYYVYNLVRSLLSMDSRYVCTLFAVPGWRRWRIDVGLALGDSELFTYRWILPRRLSSLLFQTPWQRWITIERFVGSLDLFHSTNFLCLPQKEGRRVVTVFDLTFILFPQYHPRYRVMVFKNFFSRSLELADKVIAISENTKQDLVDLMQVPREKIDVTPLAAGENFKPMSAQDSERVLSQYGITYRDYFLYVGTIEPRKNLISLLKAYELFRSSSPCRYPLVLAGGSGWLNDGFYKKWEGSAYKEDIRILGYVEEAYLPSLYSGALAFVYPSLYEGFGLPPLEAMACGTPVITSNNSSLPEVTGNAAILVNPLEVKEIAEALIRIASDCSLQEDLRQKGLQRAKLFSWRETTKRTLRVYESVLNGR